MLYEVITEAYFMDIAFLVSRRSTCLRRSVGAIVVKDKRILSTGYNGAPTGIKHCLEAGCLREKMNIASGKNHELCRGIHRITSYNVCYTKLLRIALTLRKIANF